MAVCEYWLPHVSPKRRCGERASEYVMGSHRCSVHLPKGSTTCTHSLTGSGFCSFCGARVDPAGRLDDGRPEVRR